MIGIFLAALISRPLASANSRIQSISPFPTVHYIESDNIQKLEVDLLLKLPKGGPLDRAFDEVIGNTLLDDTRDFGHQELIKLTSPTGDVIQCEVLADSIHVWFAVRPVDSAALPGLIDNLLFHASLSEENVSKTINRLRNEKEDYWHLGYSGELLPYQDIRLFDLQAAYQRMCSPSNDYVEIRGPKDYKYLVSQVQQILGTEPIAKQSTYKPDPLPPKFLNTGTRPIDTIEFSMPVFTANSSEFPTCLLAMFAIGSGKGSILFRDLRQKAAWSYRQEAFFLPSENGLMPVIQIAASHGTDTQEEAKSAKETILEGIKQLTEQDKRRAISMAQAVFNRGIGMDPFAYLSNDPSDLFMQNYWWMKAGTALDSDALVHAMENVSLDQLKATGEKMVQMSQLRIVYGT